MKLYKVTFNSVDHFYVMANTNSEATEKAIEEYKKQFVLHVFGSSGSCIDSYREAYQLNVETLTDCVLG